VLAATLDPDGRRVVLDEDAWNHIKRRHPELAPRLREIMAAVREPDVRFLGRGRDEIWFYARSGTRPWLKVVVHYEGGEGWIVTAFSPPQAPRG
jgi:hypothetical protein